MSGDTKSTADNNGGTLEKLMRSLASMTGTGNLIGGLTLAGRGAGKAGDRGLLMGAPRAGPARRDSVSGNIRRADAARGAHLSRR